MANDQTEDDDEAILAAAEAMGKVPGPEKEPYRELYKARSMLEGARATASELFGARIDGRLGGIANQVEEPHVAETKLGAALKVLAPGAEREDVQGRIIEGSPRVLLDAAKALTQAALLWDGRDQPERALKLLELAATVETKDDDFETHMSFYLAQVHGRLGDTAKSAFFCRRTLERQLSNPGTDWPRNALSLGSYYATAGKPRAAVACARAAVAAYDDDEEQGEDSDLVADAYLLYARVHLEKLEEEEENNEDNDQGGDDDDGVGRAFGKWIDHSKMPVASFDDRKSTFLAAMRAFQVAGERYVLDGFVTAHVGIARDVGRLLGFRARDESDRSRRVALHERRFTTLEPLRQILHPTVYADLRAAVAFDAGDAAMAALEEKQARLEVKATHAKLRNCARLRDAAVTAYDDVRTVCLRQASGDVAKVDPDFQLPLLRSAFYSARLAGLSYADDDTASRASDSLERFTRVAAEARILLQNNLPPDTFKDELTICDDMISLLPKRIAQLRQEQDDDTSTVALPTTTTAE